jgi:hypothetical protein
MLRFKIGTLIISLFALFLATGEAVKADTIEIAEPSAAYLASTTSIDFDATTFPLALYVSDGIESLSYNSPLTIGSVPNSWSTWGKYPNVASENPVIGEIQGDAELLIQLSAPATTFGFELEPESFLQEGVSAYFYNTAGSLLGQIDRKPDGDGGALLYALSSSIDPISSVYIVDEASDGFAIADQRYSLTALVPSPEPRSIWLVIVGISFTVLLSRLRVKSLRFFLGWRHGLPR